MSKDHQDEALRKARETIRDLDRDRQQEKSRTDFEEEAAKPTGGFAEQIRETAKAARTINKAVGIASKAYEKLKKYTAPVFWIAGKLVRGAGTAFKHAAYMKNRDGSFKLDEDGDMIFSGNKLACTFGVATCIGLSAYTGMNYAYYNGTHFEELVYTTGKQEIVSGELYHVTGCTSLPCSTDSDNGKYYQITQSWFAPRLLYPEETVYANIPQQIAACHFEGYGIYFKSLKPIMRWAEWYQNIESASCRTLTEAEIQQSIHDGGAPEVPLTRPAPTETAPAPAQAPAPALQ